MSMGTRKLIVGLGNPGPKYDGTRHNVGFEAVDRLAQSSHGCRFARKFDGLLAEAEIDFRRVLLLKPQTFMNLSGRSVGQAVSFYKLDPSADLLVICDDISLPLAKLRLRAKGSHGGQNGLRDLIRHLGTQEFPRLRIGVGDPGPADPAEYVLGRFRNAERPEVDDALIAATQAAAIWVSRGLDEAMNRFNGVEGGGGR